MYLGLFELGTTINAAIPICIADVPIDPSGGNPTFRIYEGATLLTNGVGSLTPMDTGTITGATNATPIVITSNNHGLETGNIVTIKNVAGNTAANGTWTVTKVGPNTFSLNTSVGNGSYTSGGTWHVTGLYLFSLAISQGNGFDVGGTYQMRIDFTNSSTPYVKQAYFSVT